MMPATHPAAQPAAYKPPYKRQADIHPERLAWYRALWGDDEGYTLITGALTAPEIVARGWPLAKDEPLDPDKICLMVWERDTYDEFKAAGRPHTARTFHWPRQAAALDKYVAKLDEQGYDVFTRKYLSETENGAKHGDAPARASLILVEDAPRAPEPLAPAYSGVLVTSPYSRHAIYRLTRPLPWSQIQALASGAKERLHADNGGPNAAQFTRVPGTRNSKAKADGWTVCYAPGADPITPEALARAVGVNLATVGRASSSEPRQRSSGGKGGPGADDPKWCALVEQAKDWRGYIWRDGQPWRGGMLLREDGTPRVLKDPNHFVNRVLRGELTWAEAAAGWGGKDPTPSGWTYHLFGALLRATRDIVQTIALMEALDPDARRKGDAHFYHQNLWGCAYRVSANSQGWVILLGELTPRVFRNFKPRPVDIPPAGPRRGRPIGAKAGNVDRLAALLVEHCGELVTRATLAAALDITPRSITSHIKNLIDAGRLEITPQRYGFIVARVENKYAPDQGGNIAANEALQSDTPVHEGSHPAPSMPPPAGGPAATNAGDAPPVELATSTPQPIDRAALDQAQADIAAAIAAIKAQTYDEIIPETGEIVTRHERATRAKVAALLPDMPPELFDAAWKRHGDIWGNERRRLWQLDPAALSGAARTATRRYAQALKRESPRLAYYATMAEIAADVCQRRGIDPNAPKQRKRRKSRDDAAIAAKETRERMPALVRLFDAVTGDSITTAPMERHLFSPPDDGAPHPADVASSQAARAERAGCVPSNQADSTEDPGPPPPPSAPATVEPAGGKPPGCVPPSTGELDPIRIPDAESMIERLKARRAMAA